MHLKDSVVHAFDVEEYFISSTYTWLHCDLMRFIRYHISQNSTCSVQVFLCLFDLENTYAGTFVS